MRSKSLNGAALPRRAARVWGLALLGHVLALASCHPPVPEVAPSSPPLGPRDASEASSVSPEPSSPPLETGSSGPTPEAPADPPSSTPDVSPAAPSVAPPAEPPSASPPELPVPPASPPELPSPPPPRTSRPPKTTAPAAAVAPKPAGYTGEQPCQAATFQVKAVEKACREGGRRAAKDVMKQAVANARAKGEMLKCTSCHVDQKTYALQPNAVKELLRWL